MIIYPRCALLSTIGVTMLLACSGPATSGTTLTVREPECAPVLHLAATSPSDLRRDSAYIDSITPDAVRQRVDRVLYAEAVDLNCDGQLDYIAQALGDAPERTEPELLFIAFLRDGDRWTEVLSSPSPVAGPETLVVAADLNSDGHLDIVTWGADEGGYVPRIFVSKGRSYEPVDVPDVYALRFEEAWDSDCRSRVQPMLVGSIQLQLTRETIAPTELLGHGSNCELPTDTLVLREGALSLTSEG